MDIETIPGSDAFHKEATFGNSAIGLRFRLEEKKILLQWKCNNKNEDRILLAPE